MVDQLSDAGRRVVASAQLEARRMAHARVGTEHLLLGLLAEPNGEARDALVGVGATLEAARHKVAEAVPASDAPLGPGELELTPRATRALERGTRFSLQRRAAGVDSSHVLLGVLDVEGLACQVLRGLGVDVAGLRAVVAGERKPTHETAPPPAPASEPSVHCPSCGLPLAGNLWTTELAAGSGDDQSVRVVVIACAACGAAMGAHPV